MKLGAFRYAAWALSIVSPFKNLDTRKSCVLFLHICFQCNQDKYHSESAPFITQLTVCLSVVSVLALLQPGFKPYWTLWFGLILQADAISNASFYCYVITSSSLLIITKCTLTHALEPAVFHSHTHTHFRLRLVNLSLSQGWKTKPALKKTYKFFPFT